MARVEVGELTRIGFDGAALAEVKPYARSAMEILVANQTRQRTVTGTRSDGIPILLSGNENYEERRGQI